jgi:hypothetical protein
VSKTRTMRVTYLFDHVRLVDSMVTVDEPL